MKTECKWTFAERKANDEAQGPNSAMSQTFAQFPCKSLVRESIQNSLDAALDENEPVTVCFEYRTFDKNDEKGFFDLKSHIEACREKFPTDETAQLMYPRMIRILDSNEELGFIRVSDYNTKGMDYEEGSTDKTFYAFVRAQGVSVKHSKGAGGSFGFGKGAFFVMSPINTIVVSTMTADGKCYFEGVSRLCTHEYDGLMRSPMGFYDCNEGFPTTDTEKMPMAFKRNCPGTSIGIMGIDRESWEKSKVELIKEVLRNFFVAILRKKLVVMIDGNVERGNNTIVIDNNNIDSLMEKYFLDTRDVRDTGGNKPFNPRPYYEALTDPKVQPIQKVLPTLGRVTLYLKYFEGNSTNIIFMRKPLMKVGKISRNIGNFNGVFICESEEGNQILADMEGPEHKEWHPEHCRGNEHETKTDEATAQKAYEEFIDFINSSLDEAIGVNSSESQIVVGLDKYLPSDDAVMGNGEKGNPFYGQRTGNYVDEGASLNTEGAVKQYDGKKPKKNEGTVFETSTGTFEHNDEGDTTGGTGGSNSGTGGGVSGPGINFGRGDIVDNRGHYKHRLNVEWRPIISKDKGYMDIVIYLNESVENAELHFSIGSEGAKKRTSTDDVRIEHANMGNINNLVLSDVCLWANRKNVIKIKFSDHMSHTLNLGVYEPAN